MNKTYRLFSIVAYDESETMSFNNILENIIKHDLKYFYIRHFKEEEEEKDHYHIMIYFETATTISKVAKLLNIQENYIQIKDKTGQRYTLKKSVGYFLHYNNNDKIEYQFEDIKTNCIDLVKKYYDILSGGNNENNELKEIISFIEDNGPTPKEVLKFCIENNILKTFKKYSYILYHITNYER